MAAVAERLEVQRAIAANPATIFEVLTDPHGHVAIDSSGMLMDATGDPVRSVGDSFVVHMDREALNDYPLGLYDVTVRIVTLEPDREIAWKIEGQLNLGHVYGYKLKPIDEGTLVTSYYDWSSVDQSWKTRLFSRLFPRVRSVPHLESLRAPWHRAALGPRPEHQHFWSGQGSSKERGHCCFDEDTKSAGGWIPTDSLQCCNQSQLHSTSPRPVASISGDPTHVHGSSPVRTNEIWYHCHRLAVRPNLNRGRWSGTHRQISSAVGVVLAAR